jgi:hypothetical protein
MMRIASGMQNLHAYLTILFVHSIRYQSMVAHFTLVGKLSRIGSEFTEDVGGNASGNDESNATASARSVKRSKLLESVLIFFKSGVHRAHDYAILERSKSQIDRRQQFIERHKRKVGKIGK